MKQIQCIYCYVYFFVYMATRFTAEQMKEIHRAAGVENTVQRKNRETFVGATTEVPVSAETQPVSVVDEVNQQSRHAVALDLAEVRAHIAAMDSAAAPVERVPGPKDAQALDVAAIHEELDKRDVGLSGGFFAKLRKLFRTRS